eukprot:3541839-Pleurochrysis_carterae.AAC.11
MRRLAKQRPSQVRDLHIKRLGAFLPGSSSATVGSGAGASSTAAISKAEGRRDSTALSRRDSKALSRRESRLDSFEQGAAERPRLSQRRSKSRGLDTPPSPPSSPPPASVDTSPSSSTERPIFTSEKGSPPSSTDLLVPVPARDRPPTSPLAPTLPHDSLSAPNMPPAAPSASAPSQAAASDA